MWLYITSYVCMACLTAFVSIIFEKHDQHERGNGYVVNEGGYIFWISAFWPISVPTLLGILALTLFMSGVDKSTTAIAKKFTK